MGITRWMEARFRRHLTIRVLDAFCGEWREYRVELESWESPYFDGEVVNLERERMKRQVGLCGDDWKPV